MFPNEIWTTIFQYITNEKDIINLAVTSKGIQAILRKSITCIKYENNSDNIKLACKLKNLVMINGDIDPANSYSLLKLARLPKLKQLDVALWHNEFPYPIFSILDFVTLYCSSHQRTLHDTNFSFRLGSNIYITIRKGIVFDFQNNDPDINKLIVGMMKLGILRGIVINLEHHDELIENIIDLNKYKPHNVQYSIPILELGLITNLQDYYPHCNLLNVKEIAGGSISLSDIEYYDDIADDIDKPLKSLGEVFIQQFAHTRVYNTIERIKFPCNIKNLPVIFTMFPNIKYLGLNGDVKNFEKLNDTIISLKQKGIQVCVYTSYKYYRFSVNGVKIIKVD